MPTQDLPHPATTSGPPRDKHDDFDDSRAVKKDEDRIMDRSDRRPFEPPPVHEMAQPPPDLCHLHQGILPC